MDSDAIGTGNPQKLTTLRPEQRRSNLGHGFRKYLNNIVEQDRRAIKRVTKPMLNFKSFRSAACVLAGIELMHMIGKGRFRIDGSDMMSVAERFYALAGQVRPF